MWGKMYICDDQNTVGFVEIFKPFPIPAKRHLGICFKSQFIESVGLTIKRSVNCSLIDMDTKLRTECIGKGVDYVKNSSTACYLCNIRIILKVFRRVAVHHVFYYTMF